VSKGKSREEQCLTNDLVVLAELRDDDETEADILSGTFNSAKLGDSSAALPLRHKVLELGERLARLETGDPATRVESQSWPSIWVIKLTVSGAKLSHTTGKRKKRSKSF